MCDAAANSAFNAMVSGTKPAPASVPIEKHSAFRVTSCLPGPAATIASPAPKRAALPYGDKPSLGRSGTVDLGRDGGGGQSHAGASIGVHVSKFQTESQL